MADNSMNFLGERYQIQSILGHGGMATVYKAYDANLRRVVAVKIIHPHLSANPEFVLRFEEEAVLVAQLHQPNIPIIYDFDHSGDSYYIVMEYIDGETLEKRLKNLNQAGQRLPVSTAVHYMIDLCKAAHYAHQRGIIHRDIKPANILIDGEEKIFLMDFGIAKIIGGQKHTATGMMIGSAHYIAPESIQGLLVDARVDVYALGVTLFEMLNGEPPFQADSVMTLMMMHLNDPIPDIHALHPDVPTDLVPIITKAMAKNRDERYRTAIEMAADLQHALDRLLKMPPGAVRPVDNDALGATFIEGAAVISNTPQAAVSSGSQAGSQASTQATPEGRRAEVMFPQTPEESPYPVGRKKSKSWLILLVVLIVGIIAGGSFFIFGRNENKPAQIPVSSPTGLALVVPGASLPLAMITLNPTEAPTTTIAITDTLEPTRLSTATTSPTVTATSLPDNSGFINNCIDVSTWTPYKTQGIQEQPAGCWDLTHWGMASNNDNLSIVMSNSPGASERSIYRALSQSAMIQMKIKVNALNTLSDLSGGLAFGVSRPESWQNGGRFLLFRYNGVKSSMQVFLSNGVKSEGSYYQDAELGSEIELEIHFVNGEISFYLDGAEIGSPYGLSPNVVENPVFSIGYAFPANGMINTEIMGLAVAEK